MTHAAGKDELGALVQEYTGDTGRALGSAVSWLLAGIMGTAIGLPLSAAYVPDTNGSYSPFPGIVLGLGLVGLAIGVTVLVRWSKLRSEAFRLHRDGFVHQLRGAERAVRWEDIADIQYEENNRPAARPLGRDVDCRIHLRDGARIHLSGFIRHAPDLAIALRKAHHTRTDREG